MENNNYFLLIWLVLVGAMVTISYIRGKKALEIFPPASSVKILFRETMASGRSKKSWKTKMSGASGVLEVMITDKELWIRLPLLLAGFGMSSGLIKRLDLSQVAEARIVNKHVLVFIRDQADSNFELTLKLKQAEQFVRVITERKA